MEIDTGRIDDAILVLLYLPLNRNGRGVADLCPETEVKESCSDADDRITDGEYHLCPSGRDPVPDHPTLL